MSKLIGKWQFFSSENIEEGLKALDAPKERIAMLVAGKPNVQFFKDEDTWSVKLEMGDITREYSFKCGEEFDSKTLSGHPAKSIITLDGDTMTEVQTLVDKDKEIKILRTADDSFLSAEMYVGDQKITMKFKRV